MSEATPKTTAELLARLDQTWESLESTLGRLTQAQLTAIQDDEPANLSSICVLAEMSGRTMLLTGDARGDDIIAGLRAAGLMGEDDQVFACDLLKMPHHCSSRNVDEASTEVRSPARTGTPVTT